MKDWGWLWLQENSLELDLRSPDPLEPKQWSPEGFLLFGTRSVEHRTATPSKAKWSNLATILDAHPETQEELAWKILQYIKEKPQPKMGLQSIDALLRGEGKPPFNLHFIYGEVSTTHLVIRESRGFPRWTVDLVKPNIRHGVLQQALSLVGVLKTFRSPFTPELTTDV